MAVKRQVSLKGLRAITKHNVIKELNKLNLTKKEYHELLELIEKHINDATHEDLKKKGIVKEIIGGMKRPRNDQHGDQPIKRGLFSKIIGSFKGESTNDEIYTMEKRIQDLKKVFSTEEELEKEYKIAVDRTREAKINEQSIASSIANIRNQKLVELEKTSNYFKHRKGFIEEIKQKYADIVRDIKHNLEEESQETDEIPFQEIKVYDAIYYTITKQHLPQFEEIMSRFDSSISSSAEIPPPLQLPPPVPPSFLIPPVLIPSSSLSSSTQSQLPSSTQSQLPSLSSFQPLVPPLPRPPPKPKPEEQEVYEHDKQHSRRACDSRRANHLNGA